MPSRIWACKHLDIERWFGIVNIKARKFRKQGEIAALSHWRDISLQCGVYVYYGQFVLAVKSIITKGLKYSVLAIFPEAAF
jgi:hypothetical protein